MHGVFITMYKYNISTKTTEGPRLSQQPYIIGIELTEKQLQTRSERGLSLQVLETHLSNKTQESVWFLKM